MSTPLRLSHEARSGNLVPFVGAGISMNVMSKSQAPLFCSWRNLFQKIAERVREHGNILLATQITNTVSEGTIGHAEVYKVIAQQAKLYLGLHAWNKLLKESFFGNDDILSLCDDSSLAVPRAVWELGSQLIITTNYDNVLEAASGTNSLSITNRHEKELSRMSDYTSSRRKTVWHMHGSIDHADSIILDSDSYTEYKDTLNRFRLEFQSLAESKTLVFLGCSMTDQDLVELLDSIYKKIGKKHYAICAADHAKELREKLNSPLRDCLHFVEYTPDTQTQSNPHSAPLLAILREIGTNSSAVISDSAQVVNGGSGVVVDKSKKSTTKTALKSDSGAIRKTARQSKSEPPSSSKTKQRVKSTPQTDERIHGTAPRKPNHNRESKSINPDLFHRIQSDASKLAESLKADAKKINDLATFEQLTLLSKDLDNALYCVVLLGKTKSGKSTLFNALVGAEVSPVGWLPETGTTIMAVPGSEERILLIGRDGKTTSIDGKPSAERIRQFSTLKGGKSTNIASVQVTLSSHELAQGLGLGDIPGFDDEKPWLVEVVKGAFERAHAFIMVLDVNNLVFDQATISWLRSIKKQGKRILIVCNKSAELGESEKRDGTDHVVEELKRLDLYDQLAYSAPIFIDAKTAWLSMQQGKEIPASFLDFKSILWSHLLESEKLGIYRLKRAIEDLNRAGQTLIGNISLQIDTTTTVANKLASLNKLLNRLLHIEKLAQLREKDLSEGLEQWTEIAIKSVNKQFQQRESEFSALWLTSRKRECLKRILDESLNTLIEEFRRAVSSKIGDLLEQVDLGQQELWQIGKDEKFAKLNEKLLYSIKDIKIDGFEVQLSDSWLGVFVGGVLASTVGVGVELLAAALGVPLSGAGMATVSSVLNKLLIVSEGEKDPVRAMEIYVKEKVHPSLSNFLIGEFAKFREFLNGVYRSTITVHDKIQNGQMPSDNEQQMLFRIRVNAQNVLAKLLTMTEEIVATQRPS